MILKHEIALVILLLLNGLPGKDCLAKNSINPFQGTWVNEYGGVDITQCNKMKCKIGITTAYGAYICDLEGKLNTLSNHEAFFST